MQLCIGTSLAIIVPTALRSYRAHRARGWSSGGLAAWTVPAIVGVALGSAAGRRRAAGLFKAAFAAIAGLIAAKLLFGRESWIFGSDLPGRAAMAAYGFLIGLGSSLIGISGGSLVTMILTLYRKTIHQAVATAARARRADHDRRHDRLRAGRAAASGALPPLSLGFVSAIGVVMIAPVSSYVAPFGARLAHRLPRRWLEIGFGLFLLLAAARFLSGRLAG